MGRLIPESEIERVKRSADLVALVQSRGIELRKHGTKDLVGRCPFHADGETPNLIVSPDKGLWHCMACGKAGNAIQFVAQHDGVSFRHAFELLAHGQGAAFAAQPLTRHCTVPRLPCPLDPEADDATLFGQVASYYHERFQASPVAREYLAGRGLDDPETIERFQIGFADRSLGLRLPYRNRDEGERLRLRLQQLGLWRESGHEHFNGCIVIAFHDADGKPVSLYGRRVTPGTVRHLYPPGPHRGLFNPEAFAADEVILCEAVIDALTFWRHGFRNVSALFGTEGFTDELWEALARVKRVRLAYDADEAGDRAAERDAVRLRQAGIEVSRVKFPWGMDANEYARKVTPARQSLALLLNAASWQANQAEPGPTAAAPPAPPKHEAMEVDEVRGDPLPIVSHESLTTGVGWAPVPFVPAPYGEVLAQEAASSSLAASVSSLDGAAAKEEKPVAPVVPASPSICTALCPSGNAWVIQIDGREYRVSGLEKTLGTDALKVTLRLRVVGQGPALLFHLDQLDLARDQERRRFIERAAEETGLLPELLKRDLGRLLLAVEEAQAELAKPAEETPVVTLSPEEREEALAWLRAPDLVGRLRDGFRQAGIVGEENNALVAYLAGVSRKLDRPLAIIVQSASAAGKTTLMDAVLSFFPEEERVKYSAMTGQSLYYLGETNLRHKILAVVEEAGAEKASYALKLLQSEGELTIASTGKDPATGKMVTQEYRVEGPVAIFLTTTAIDLDEELQNRCLTLAVDESPEQTGRIHQLQRERRTLAGLVAKQERQTVLRVLRNAQRLLAPLEVLNPYAPALTFATGRTRSRRDHEKYLTLIDAIALLHQHQRPMKALGEGPMGGSTSYIEVTLDDIALANQLAPEVLGRSLDELPPQTRRLLGHIRELMKNRGTATSRPSGKVGAGSACCFSRKELRETCGWSLTQVTVHLDRLVALEYLAVRHGRLGSAFSYEILFDVDAPEVVAHVGLIDVTALRHEYEANLTGSRPGMSGRNGYLTGGDQTGPVSSSADHADAWTEPHGVKGSRIRGHVARATL
ncbi:MAG: toprim domain-containing protein [Verrucomicrobiales bacterium]|nr:toprim domain-containing protein [Verrucomicrobiales bacterium]